MWKVLDAVIATIVNKIYIVKVVEQYLNENSIEYSQKEHVCEYGISTPVYILNDGKLELWCIESQKYRIDYSKRFGDVQKGVNKKYFENITKEKMLAGIRVIFIKDYEVYTPRMWNVLKSYIKTAVGKVENRYYARDCYLKVIDNKTNKPFLEENCFYGYRSSSIILGLYAKKDKGAIKKDELLFTYSFGVNFFGKNTETPDIEIIRVATKLNTQVIGGASKCLKYFIDNYKQITVGKSQRVVDVKRLKFYVDLDHNSCQSMYTLGFTEVSLGGEGFMNYALEDIPELNIKKNTAFQRIPTKHSFIMQLMSEGKVISIPTAGVGVFTLDINNGV